MVPCVTALVQFETTDGLFVEVAIKVCDPEEGEADVAAGEILNGIQDYIDSQNEAAAYHDSGEDFQ